VTEVNVQGSPTPFSASDPAGNLVGLGAASGLIDVNNGSSQAVNINAAPVMVSTPAPVVIPQPYIPPVDTAPITTTNPTSNPKAPIFLGGHETVNNPVMNVVPTGISNTISNLSAKAKSNPLLLYGGIAAVLYFAFKGK
jgi:hypothetical protein